MHAAKVESIAQLLTGGVGFVVAIGKFALVAYQTARYTSQLISVAAIVSGFLVFVAKESIYSVLDAVGATKCAYTPGFSVGSPCFLISCAITSPSLLDSGHALTSL